MGHLEACTENELPRWEPLGTGVLIKLAAAKAEKKASNYPVPISSFVLWLEVSDQQFLMLLYNLGEHIFRPALGLIRLSTALRGLSYSQVQK